MFSINRLKLLYDKGCHISKSINGNVLGHTLISRSAVTGRHSKVIKILDLALNISNPLT